MSKIEEIPQNNVNSEKLELKKFVCEFCNRGFSENDNLKHLKTNVVVKMSLIFIKTFFRDKKTIMEEKNELKKQIEVLLTSRKYYI